MTPTRSYTLPYGDRQIEIGFESQSEPIVLTPKPMPGFSDPRLKFLDALHNPIGSPTLESLAKSASGSILVICSDQTRADGKVLQIEWLLDFLNSCGVHDKRVTVIVAFGSHTWLPDSKLHELLKPISDRVSVIGHDIGGPMVDCGRTKAGTPVSVNARLREASLVIPISSVVHHYFAGYGGGRKMIVPGLAALETISANHSLIWEHPHESTGGRHPMARSGILDGNPVHEDLMEAVGLALGGIPAFAVTSVMNPDKEFGFFASGDLDLALRAAAEFADEHFMVDIDEPAGIAIASAGGHPKDINIIQAHKGLDNAVRCLKPGGILLFLMACPDGAGSRVLEQYSSFTLEEIRSRLAGTYEVYGQTTHAIKTKTRDFRILTVSGADRDLLLKLGFSPTDNIEHGLSLITANLKLSDRICILPRADITIPRLRK